MFFFSEYEIASQKKLFKTNPQEFWKDKKELGHEFFSFDNQLEEIYIPDTVENIQFEAFRGCSNLKKVRLPNSIISIGQYVFYESGLEWIDIPSNVSTIGSQAFAECSNLTDVYFNEGLVNIFGNAFRDCNISSLKFPKSIKDIFHSAFQNNKT